MGSKEVGLINMLPDFPSLKNKLQASLDKHIRVRANSQEGIIGDLKKKRISEGQTNSTSMNGFEEEQRPLQHLESFGEINKGINDVSLEDILLVIEEAAEDIVKQQHKYIFQHISEVCEKTGNSINAKGVGLTADTVFEMLEKMHITFDDTGEPHMPTMCIDPKQRDQVIAIDEEINSSPEKQKRLKEIMQKKKEEWDAEETSRELVG